MIAVGRYGIHWSEGIAYLHQASGNVTALGAKNKSPFRVMRATGQCWSSLDPTNPTDLDVDPEDSFIKAIRPLPGGGAYQIEDRFLPELQNLMWMSGTSMQGATWPREAFKHHAGYKIMGREFTSTDVQPIVVTNIRPEAIQFAAKVAQAGYCRKIIFLTTATTIIPGVPRVEPRAGGYGSISRARWHRYGNKLIQEHMLNHDSGTS